MRGTEIINIVNNVKTSFQDHTPPPPTPEEARRALDEAFAEIGIFFKRKRPVIGLEKRPIFVDEFREPAPPIQPQRCGLSRNANFLQ